MLDEIERSPRFVLSLTRTLPVESALSRSFTGNVVWGWDQEMMATLTELQHATIRILVGAHGGKKVKDLKPLEVPRPWKAEVMRLQSQQRERDKAASPPKKAATMEQAMAVVGKALGGR